MNSVKKKTTHTKSNTKAREKDFEYSTSVSQMIHLPLVVLDDDLRVQYANQVFYKTFRMTPQKTKNKILFGPGKDHHWNLPQVIEPLRKSMKSKKGFLDFEVNYSFPNIGSRHVVMSGQKINWIGKNPPSILLSIQDVTKRKEVEIDGLNESKLAKVLEIVTSAANASMSLEEVSQSMLKAICIYTGWEVGHAYLLTSDPSHNPKDTTATNVYHLHHSKKFSKFWEHFEQTKPELQSGLPSQVLASGQPEWLLDVFGDPRFKSTTFETTGVRAAFAFPVFVKDKVAALLEFFSTNTSKPNQKLLKLMSGVGNQIGQVIQRKRIEDENAELMAREHSARFKAEKDNRAKDFFLATLSHELRTPLTSILLWIQIVRNEKTVNERMKQGMEAIEMSALAQEKLINDLLDTSRIIMGKLSLELSPVDLPTVILATIESLRPAALNKAVQIESELGPPIGPVSADALRLQQVIWNLLSNAIKFSPSGRKITVTLEKVLQHALPFAQIKVIDEGEGIPTHFLTTIFDWFSQADNSRIREHNGLGLGLAISRNLIQLLGGSIQADSVGENKGATLTIKLPLMNPQSRPMIQNFLGQDLSTRIADFKKIKTNLSGIKVLVIDNEENIGNALSITLGSFGALVTTALSAEQGLRSFKQFRPDVLLCDIGMPIEDGYSLIEKVRKLSLKDGGKTPSAALTAYASTSDIKNALDAGFQLHIAKPVDMPKLIQAVAKLAGRA